MVSVKLSSSSAANQTLKIDGFRGLDCSTAPFNISVARSPDALNVEPLLNGAVGCRHGYETVFRCNGQINGIYQLREHKGIRTLVHHGNRIGEWRQSGTVNSLYGYTVPAEGLTVKYGAILNSGTYEFEHAALTSENVVTFSNGNFYVDGVKQATTSGGNSSLIPIKITKCTANISRDDFGGETTRGISLGYFINTVDGNGYSKRLDCMLATMTGVSVSDIAEGGSVISYDTSSYSESTQTGTIYIDDKEYLCRVSLHPSIQLPDYTISYFHTDFDLMEAKLDNGFDYKVTYTLRVGDDEFVRFRTNALQPNDSVVYDSDTKKLYINNVEVQTDKSLIGGQAIHLSLLNDEGVSVLSDFDVIVPDQKSSCQQMGNKLYIFTGQTAYVYGEWETDAEGNTITPVYELRKMADEAYTPTVLISSSPVITDSDGKVTTSGGGVKYEDYNLLSNKAKVQFLVSSGSSSKKLPLPRSPVESVEKVEKLTAGGEWENVAVGDYTLDAETGIITFTQNLSSTPVNGRDNYRVTFVMGWFGETKPKHYVNKVSPKADLNFNPPYLEKFASKIPQSKYQEYTDGQKFTAVKYRILLGNIKEDADVSIRISNTDADGKMVFGYCPLAPRKDSYAVDGFKITASTTAAEQILQVATKTHNKYQETWVGERLSVTKDEVAVSDDGREIYFGQARVYTQVVKDGDNYYLDITQPYVICYTKKDTFSEREIVVKKTAVFNKIEINYTEKKHTYLDRIDKATICTKFGASGNVDRLFVAGWSEMSEYEFWSEIDNPLFFPDLNYACLGDEDTAIMGWSRINNNQLAIHKSSNGTDPTIYIQSAAMTQNKTQSENTKSGVFELASTYSVAFPIKEGPAGQGAVSQRAFGVLCGEPLFLSNNGIFATKYVADVATDVRYAVPRSYYINSKLKDFDLSNAECIVFDNRYYLSLGNGYVLFADGKQEFMIGGNQKYDYSYEWYLWDNVPARIWWTADNVLYFGTEDGRICRFNDRFLDDGKPINCYWTTPPLSFGTTPFYKKVRNVIVSCVLPTTDFSEVAIDYIDLKRERNVKNYMIDNTDGKRGMVQSIATNYKLKKVTALQIRVRANNAENFVLQDISVLYTASGKFKG